MVGKDTQIKQKKTSAGYTTLVPCRRQWGFHRAQCVLWARRPVLNLNCRPGQRPRFYGIVKPGNSTRCISARSVYWTATGVMVGEEP